MRSSAFVVMAMLSLIVFVATAALAIRSMLLRDRLDAVVFGHHAWVETFPHHLYAVVLGSREGPRPINARFGQTQIPASARYLEPRFYSDSFACAIAIPYWLVLLLSAPLPAWWVRLKLQRRHRRRAGLCERCGYDLRASPAGCPECGQRVPESREGPHTVT